MVEVKWKSVAGEIAAKIKSGEFGAGVRLPSGDALAREFCVNRNIVHRALDNLQHQGLVRRRQGSGTIVTVQGSPGTLRLALLVDGYSAYHNFPSGDLLHGIQERIGEGSLVIADSMHDPVLEAKCLRRLAMEVDGILLYACSPNHSETVAELVAGGFPIVAIDRMPAGVDIDAVMTDNVATVREVVRQLTEKSHRRIAYFSLQKPNFSSLNERRQGFQEEMDAHGLDSKRYSRWFPDGIPTEMLDQLITDSVFSLVRSDHPVTAIFCAEDSLGCSVMAACESLGISTTSDLEVATFIDWHPMTLRQPWNVRRVVQRKYEIGHAAANLLANRISNPSLPTQVVRIAAEIVIA